VNPVTDKIYVANGNDGTVSVIDGATYTTSSVGAGATPSAVALNPATNKIYVANTGSNDVTVIDGATNSTATVAVGTSPKVLAGIL
jgi:YVTN family beta-propeller protein